jgi:hypothetical protein
MIGRRGKFDAMKRHLETIAKTFHKGENTSYKCTFGQIEALGISLPPSAFRHRAWWANSYYNHNKFGIFVSSPWARKKPWERAKFLTEQVDMKQRTVTFRYVGELSTEGPPRERETTSHGGAAEAGRSFTTERSAVVSPAICRHPLYGALKGHIRLVAGTDLTEPADPEWGDRVWGDDTK